MMMHPTDDQDKPSQGGKGKTFAIYNVTNGKSKAIFFAFGFFSFFHARTFYTMEMNSETMLCR